MSIKKQEPTIEELRIEHEQIEAIERARSTDFIEAALLKEIARELKEFEDDLAFSNSLASH